MTWLVWPIIVAGLGAYIILIGIQIETIPPMILIGIGFLFGGVAIWMAFDGYKYRPRKKGKG